jgi:hypothetical protein
MNYSIYTPVVVYLYIMSENMLTEPVRNEQGILNMSEQLVRPISSEHRELARAIVAHAEQFADVRPRIFNNGLPKDALDKMAFIQQVLKASSWDQAEETVQLGYLISDAFHLHDDPEANRWYRVRIQTYGDKKTSADVSISAGLAENKHQSEVQQIFTLQGNKLVLMIQGDLTSKVIATFVKPLAQPGVVPGA